MCLPGPTQQGPPACPHCSMSRCLGPDGPHPNQPVAGMATIQACGSPHQAGSGVLVAATPLTLTYLLSWALPQPTRLAPKIARSLAIPPYRCGGSPHHSLLPPTQPRNALDCSLLT
mmetsp:Transcript_105598/g.182068  ORF Transcript_105598/g.182068 Transcript_105598/m.182068 type:complete len:116 (-) Transcript_105598:1809-2156(-)